MSVNSIETDYKAQELFDILNENINLDNNISNQHHFLINSNAFAREIFI